MGLIMPFRFGLIFAVAVPFPAYAQTASFNSTFTSFLPLIAIFAIMYFLLIRPQQKKAREHRHMVENLKRGDLVVTAGGLVGKVARVKDGDEIDIDLGEDIRVRVIRSTIARVMAKTEPLDSAAKPAEKPTKTSKPSKTNKTTKPKPKKSTSPKKSTPKGAD